MAILPRGEVVVQVVEGIGYSESTTMRGFGAPVVMEASTVGSPQRRIVHRREFKIVSFNRNGAFAGGRGLFS